MKNIIIIFLVLLVSVARAQERVTKVISQSFSIVPSMTLAHDKIIVLNHDTDTYHQINLTNLTLESYQGTIMNGLGQDGVTQNGTTNKVGKIAADGNEVELFSLDEAQRVSLLNGITYIAEGPNKTLYKGNEGDVSMTPFFPAGYTILGVTNDDNYVYVSKFTDSFVYKLEQIDLNGVKQSEINMPGSNQGTTHIGSTLYASMVLAGGVRGVYEYNGANWDSQIVDTGEEALKSIGGGFINGDPILFGAKLDGCVVIYVDRFIPEFTSSLAVSVDEDVEFSYTVTFSDANVSDVVTITVDENDYPSSLSFDGTATISGTPSLADVGVYNIDVTLDDGNDGVRNGILVLTISNVNDAPVFTSDLALSANEDSSFSFTATTSDEEGDDVTMTADLTNVSAFADFDAATKILSSTSNPTQDQVGVYNIDVTLDDGKEGITNVVWVLTVENVNDAPVFDSSISASTPEDSPFTYSIVARDEDGDALTFTVTNLPSWLVFDNSDQITGTPTNDEVGEYLFSINIYDGIINVDTDVVLIVANVNDSPTLTSNTIISATEDIAFAYTISGNDIDGDALTFAVSNLPSWLSFDNTDNITGTPTNDEVGEHAFNINIQDGTVTVDTDIVLTVANVNDAPILTSASTDTATEDEVYTYTIIGNDIDGDALTFAVSNLPSWLSFDNTDNITGTPTNDEVGEHTFIISTNDGTVSIDTDITLSVTNVNDAPEISLISNQTVDSGSSLEDVIFTVTDVDNDIALSDIVATSTNQDLVVDNDIKIISLSDNQYELQLKASEGVSGELSVSISASDGEIAVTADFDLSVNLVLGIADKKHTPKLRISPNPVSQLLHLDYSTSTDYQYSIYSIEGQLIFQELIKKNSIEPFIDVSSYPKGMYIIQLASKSGISIQKKFIKE